MINLLGGLVAGLGALGTPLAVILLVVGTVVGTLVGVVPGLGGIVLLVVLLPFLYNMSPLLGLTLLLAAHSAIYYAGSTTAILINTPGAPESAATAIDGYAMTLQGKTLRALGISAAATTFGGWFGTLVVIAAIPFMLFLVDLFHPPEYFFLTILAVILIGMLQSGSITKGLLSGLFGFMVAFVGVAPSTGSLRFTFGSLALYDGLPTAVVAIGLFAVSQMFILYGADFRAQAQTEFRINWAQWQEVWEGVGDVVRRLPLLLRSAAIGVICGIIPGIGSTAANFLSYGQAMRVSKHPERFGTGIPEGIIAPEGSSISKEAGALIPTVALGVPNGPAMAVLLSAFAILGLEPGPTMLTHHLPLVFSMAWVLAISSLLASVIGLVLAPVLARISMVPARALVPFVLMLTLVGAYATTTTRAQMLALLFFGVVGWAMKRYGYSLPAVIVGAVLGSSAENNVILTVKLFGWRFLERPLTDLLILVILALLVSRVRRRPAGEPLAQRPQEQVAHPAADRPVSISKGEILLDALWVAVSLAYFAIASSFPHPAEVAPMLVSGAAALVGMAQLAGAFVPRWRVATHGTGRDALAVWGFAQRVPGAVEPTRQAGRTREEGRAILLAVSLVAGIYVLGFLVAIPAFMAAYFLFLYRRSWVAIVGSAVAAGAVVYGVFISLLGLQLPTSVLGGLLHA